MVGAVEYVLRAVPREVAQAVHRADPVHLLVALVDEGLFAEVPGVGRYFRSIKLLHRRRHHEAYLNIRVSLRETVHRVQRGLNVALVVGLESLYHLVVNGVNSVDLFLACELLHLVAGAHPLLAAYQVVGKVGLEFIHPAVFVAGGDVVPADSAEHIAQVLRLVHFCVVNDIRELRQRAVLVFAALLFRESDGNYRHRKQYYGEQRRGQLRGGHVEFLVHSALLSQKLKYRNGL